MFGSFAIGREVESKKLQAMCQSTLPWHISSSQKPPEGFTWCHFGTKMNKVKVSFLIWTFDHNLAWLNFLVLFCTLGCIHNFRTVAISSDRLPVPSHNCKNDGFCPAELLKPYQARPHKNDGHIASHSDHAITKWRHELLDPSRKKTLLNLHPLHSSRIRLFEVRSFLLFEGVMFRGSKALFAELQECHRGVEVSLVGAKPETQSIKDFEHDNFHFLPEAKSPNRVALDLTGFKWTNFKKQSVYRI